MRLTDRKPDFTQLEKVLRHEVPDRPVLFEISVTAALLEKYADPDVARDWNGFGLVSNQLLISGYYALGYDYAIGRGSDFGFPMPDKDKDKSIGQAEAGVITDRESYESYEWQNPEDFDYSHLDSMDLPTGMKAVVWGPGGVLENVISLVGFQDLCFMLIDEPELVQEIFDAVGSRLLKYYELSLPYEKVGAALVNDDWGFKTQTMLSPEQMRQYVVPWHKKIVSAIHAAGKPAMMHSCGNFESMWEDVIEEIQFDGKHSYEDGIIPIEESLDRWGDRIAMLGGIDMDYLCRKTPEEITVRARALLAKTAETGGYALGSGNSIPDYVPEENYLAMVKVGLEG